LRASGLGLRVQSLGFRVESLGVTGLGVGYMGRFRVSRFLRVASNCDKVGGACVPAAM